MVGSADRPGPPGCRRFWQDRRAAIGRVTCGGWQRRCIHGGGHRRRATSRADDRRRASVIVIYVLVNVALLRVLPVPRSRTPCRRLTAQIVTGPSRAAIIVLRSFAPRRCQRDHDDGTRIIARPPRVSAPGPARQRRRRAVAMPSPPSWRLRSSRPAFQKLRPSRRSSRANWLSICCLALVVFTAEANRRPFRARKLSVLAAIVLVGAAAFLVSALVAGTRTRVTRRLAAAGASRGRWPATP